MGYYRPMTKTTNNGTKNKQKSVIFTVLGLLLFGALTLVVLQKISIKNDLARFQAVEKQKNQIVKQLTDYLGNNVVSTWESNECFNTEQGPYDNGYLWCQTATIIKLSSSVDYKVLGQEYSKIGSTEGYKVTSTGDPFPSYSLMTKQKISCELESRDSGRDTGASRMAPFKGEEQSAAAITCADRAKAKHYPYVAD